MEILVLHPGGLGDIILSLPALDLLRKQFPAASIALAGNLDHLMPAANRHADRSIALSSVPLHHLYAHYPVPEDVAGCFRSFDRIISWTGSGNEAFVRKLGEIHSNVLVASWRPGPDETRHVSQLFVDSIKPWIPPDWQATPAGIFLNPVECEAGDLWLAERNWNEGDALVAFHPGAGSAAKRWPQDKFIALANELLLRKETRLLIVEGPAETGSGRQIAERLKSSRVLLIESAPLSLLAAVLRHAGRYLGNDSGISHLAAGLGIRSVVLFGPTSPEHWAPIGNHVAVIRDESCRLDRIPIEQVLDSIAVPEV